MYERIMGLSERGLHNFNEMLNCIGYKLDGDYAAAADGKEAAADEVDTLMTLSLVFKFISAADLKKTNGKLKKHGLKLVEL